MRYGDLAGHLDKTNSINFVTNPVRHIVPLERTSLAGFKTLNNKKPIESSLIDKSAKRPWRFYACTPNIER